MTNKGSKSYTNFKFNSKDTILLGRERAGVPESLHKLIKHRLRIPMHENDRYLNITSTVALVLAERVRHTGLL